MMVLHEKGAYLSWYVPKIYECIYIGYTVGDLILILIQRFNW